MGNFFTETGTPTAEGQKILGTVKLAIQDLVESDAVYRLNQAELLTLGGHLAKIAGEAISNKIAYKLRLTHKYQSMTDDEFRAYLKDKYGNCWPIVSIEVEELQRMPQEDLEKVAQDRNFLCDSLVDYMHSIKM